MVTTETATSEDVLREVRDVAQRVQDFMQMTSDQFVVIDENFHRHDAVFTDLQSSAYRIERRLEAQTRTIWDTEKELLSMHVDIDEILHRVTVLERKDKLDDAERTEAQALLQRVIDWTKAAAARIDVPLERVSEA